MCGIAGIHDPDGVRASDLDLMNQVQAHRGPDGAFKHVDAAVGLAHRRLSIIDLAGGDQPIFSADGQRAIVFNGEIYNYRELRARLENSGPFKTHSDTEVVLRLYELHGTDCVKHLRGMFAFAIYDKTRDEIFLARDHLGQKPLYYAHRGAWFAFASEIKGLLAIAPDLRQMDDAALHEYLTLRIISPPRSMYREVRKLPPAHFMVFKAGKLRIERYWTLDYSHKISGSTEELCDELDARVAEAVRYNTVSDVPIGAFLSGGLDSSLIVAMMRRTTDAAFPTFSGGVPYEGFSELPFARRVAEKYATDHHEMTIRPSLVQSLPDLVWHLDEPSDALSVCMYHIAKVARKHVKVALGGDGGDELFGGYDRYVGNRYTSLYALLPQALRQYVLGALLKRVPEGRWYRSLGHKLQWMHQMSFFEGGLRYGKSLSYFHLSDEHRAQIYAPEFARRAAVFDPEANIARYFEAANAEDLVDRMLYADSMVRMPDHPSMILDRVCMAHGLEARSPFMDHELAEFCASLPVRVKVQGTRLRVLETELAKRLLPPELMKRSKQGFASALPYILADEYTHLYRVLLQDAHLVSNGYLTRDGVNGMVEEHLAGKADHGNRLWQLCNAEVWYRMNIAGLDREQLRETIART